MPLVDKAMLIAKLAPPLDAQLASQLVEEFISLERRFILRDWEPAELDGGQFAEIMGRVLYHLDSGNLDRSRDLGDCSKFIHNDQVSHNIARDDAKSIMMVITVVHKFRSKRGAVHISPTYRANHMDARFMVESVRWAMNELIRLFATGSKEDVAKVVRELLRFEMPVVGKFEDTILIQRTGLSAEEELLLLLHYAGETGFTRTQLGQFARCSAPSITRSLDNLTSPQKRQAILLGTRFILTDLGHKRIREQMADKLTAE